MLIGPYTFDGINPLAVLVAAISTMVVGFVWYAILFRRPWIRLMGYDPDDKAKLSQMRRGAGKSYALTFLAAVVSAVVLAKIIDVTTVNSVFYGMKIGFAVWLGFVTTVQLTGALFAKQSAKLYLINTGYQLVCFLVMGGILAKWPH